MSTVSIIMLDGSGAYLEESAEVTIGEAAMVASCPAALGRDDEAPRTLRARVAQG